MENQNSSVTKWLAISIIIASVIISGTILYSNANKSSNSNVYQQPENNAAGNQPVVQGNTASLDLMDEISAEDHVKGNRDAFVKIVEYSDTECPFCKRFHETMNQVIDEYGSSGKVAWVYRHFPLAQLHSKAAKEAEATECANELGGNDKFWAYIDRLFEITPANNGLDASELPKIAQYVGLDVNKFNTCLNGGKYASHIQEDLQNAGETGGNGTPWSIVVVSNGKKFPLSGAQPYESVKQLIELALQEK